MRRRDGHGESKYEYYWKKVPFYEVDKFFHMI